MRKILFAISLLGALTLALAVSAAAPANFAGTWNLDKAKSQGLSPRLQESPAASLPLALPLLAPLREVAVAVAPAWAVRKPITSMAVKPIRKMARPRQRAKPRGQAMGRHWSCRQRPPSPAKTVLNEPAPARISYNFPETARF